MELIVILHSNRGIDMSWLIYAILGVLLLGAAPVFAKNGMRKCSSDLAAAVYGTVLFIAVNCIVSFTDTPLDLTKMKLTAFMYLLFSGFAIGVAWICFFRALRRGPINGVIPMVEASLIIEILAGMFLFQDGLSVNKFVILVLLIVGTICVCIRPVGKKGKNKKKGKWINYALSAMVFTSLAALLERIGIGEINEHLKQLVCYAVALIVVWILTFMTGAQKGLHSMSFLDGIYICLSAACVGGAKNCFYKAELLSTGFNIELIALLDMAVAILFGYMFMKERLSTRVIFGIILMLAGFLFWHLNLPSIPL